jgi:hypothetical protein
MSYIQLADIGHKAFDFREKTGAAEMAAPVKPMVSYGEKLG